MREPRRWGFSVSRSEYFQVSVINGSKVGGAGSCPQVVFVAVVSQRSTRQMLEPGDMLHGDLIDTHAQPIQELQPQLQARRVRANRGRGPVQRLQMCQKRLHRGHRLAARVKDGPGLRPVRHQHPLHPHRDLLPRCVTSTEEGSYDSPDPTKSAPTHRRPSAAHPTLANPDDGDTDTENASTTRAFTQRSDVKDTLKQLQRLPFIFCSARSDLTGSRPQ